MIENNLKENQEEIWSPIPKFEGLYEISNFKRVRKIYSNDRWHGKIMTPDIFPSYLRFHLTKNGKINEYIVSTNNTENLNGEIWTDINGYSSYQVSNLGRIKRKEKIEMFGNHLGKRNERILKPCPNNRGYLLIGLSENNNRTSHTVHSLVALAFIKNPNNYPQVNHKNTIKTDNRVENLEWATKSMNLIHAYKMGVRKPTQGSLSGRTKLTEEDVLKIRKDYEHLTVKQISIKYNLTFRHAESILYRETWKHI